MSVEIHINITFPSAEHLSATWSSLADPPRDRQQPDPAAGQRSPAPEVRVIPIGTSVLAPGLVTPFGV
jgi:hypothetical protein